MKAIVLAAGYATRLRPLTDSIPKMLLPLAGRPMLDYLIDRIDAVEEIDEVHVVTNARFAGDIAFTIEQAGLEGADLFVVAGDNLIEYGLDDFVRFWREKGEGAAIAVHRVADRELIKQYGVVELDEGDRVVSLEEKPSRPRSDLAATAAYLYPAEHAAWIERQSRALRSLSAGGDSPAYAGRGSLGGGYGEPRSLVDLNRH